MLNKTDNLRARFAPNDPVRFKYRRRTMEGTLLRTNPRRAIVRVDNEEYHVPYECLISIGDTGQQRVERMEAILELAQRLMHEHGLKKWRFKFDHSTRRAGCCTYHDKRISISFDLPYVRRQAHLRALLRNRLSKPIFPSQRSRP